MTGSRTRSVIRLLACAMTALWFVMAVSGCGPNRQQQDDALAGKYRDVARSIKNAASVTADYRTFTGMGASGNITITASTDDRQAMQGIMREALPGIARVENPQDQASIVIRVVAPDGFSPVIPDALGFKGDGTGAGTLAAFRAFVDGQGMKKDG